MITDTTGRRPRLTTVARPVEHELVHLTDGRTYLWTTAAEQAKLVVMAEHDDATKARAIETGSGAAIGALVGSVAGPIGTVAGAVAGTILGPKYLTGVVAKVTDRLGINKR